MEEYCEEMFKSAENKQGDDFFPALNETDLNEHKLTMEEKPGNANNAFERGRDIERGQSKG